MRPRTLRQVLNFLDELSANWKPGDSVPKACQKATRVIADEHQVAYSTIQEACVQRLGYANVDELHADLEAWLETDQSRDLSIRIKSHTPASMHPEVNEFFGPSTGMNEKELALVAIRALPDSATLSDAIERLHRLASR